MIAPKFRTLPEALRIALEKEIKMLLHAARDAMRNKKVDTFFSTFVIDDSYSAEAFGVVRAVKIMGYGDFGAVNATPALPPNLSAWFSELERNVLKEENWQGNGKCDFCFEKYGKDDARMNK